MNPAIPDPPMTPMQSALAIIKHEHDALATVLQVLQLLVKQAQQYAAAPDFTLLATVLYYIDAFPEQFHHPKEEGYLFKLLRASTDQADAVLDELQGEHVRGSGLVRDLERALVHHQGGSPSGLDDFARAAERYAEFMLAHMRKEEDLVIPVAETALLPADWLMIDAAFRAHQDPLFGPLPQQEFGRLYARIADLAPKKLKRLMRDKREQQE